MKEAVLVMADIAVLLVDEPLEGRPSATRRFRHLLLCVRYHSDG